MIYLCKNILSNNNFMKRRKSANKQTNERKREIKLPQTKNQYETLIKKTPNQHTQSIIQKEI